MTLSFAHDNIKDAYYAYALIEYTNLTYEEEYMTLSSHLAQLAKKHSELEDRIEEQMKSPSPDTVLIHALKKEKLHLKDTITKHQQDNT